jgi:hypothetical protein
MDRFLTMVALESLIRHHDGYSMGINNYRVYHDPATGRAVFIPGGMDQLFFSPQASLLPDLRGVLSKAVLETQTGRSQFRERCLALYTNLFPGLSNRFERTRMRIRPVLAEMDPGTVRRSDEAATNLFQRIQQRQHHLSRELSAPAQAPAFDKTGVARLTNWVATVEGGRPIMFETNSDAGQMLVVQTGGEGEKMSARWQSLVLLKSGTYRFSASVTADQPVFRGPTASAVLRVWGLSDVHLETRRTTRERMEFQCVFTVQPGLEGEYVLHCECGGLEVTVAYRFESVVLARL